MRGNYWHSISAKNVLKNLGVTTAGLQSTKAEKQLADQGYNEVADAKRVSPLVVFISQFRSPLVYVLVLAGIIAYVLKDTIEAYTIGCILLLNAILGFVQEYRAQEAVAALKKLSAPNAKVLRDGVVKEIPAREVVVGDILQLEAGDIVAADARILTSENLHVDESMLTGESEPSEKITKPLPQQTRIADQENMVFSGTNVTHGSGKVVVVGIGADTQFGKIADHLRSTEESETPLQKKFALLAKQIGIGAGVLLVLVLVIGSIAAHMPFLELVKLVLILAVATVPSALPLILTISLSFGTKRLAQQNLLVKRLPAAEALGSTTVICTDKTGTLTQNAMTVTNVYMDGQSFSVTGYGYERNGDVMRVPSKLEAQLQLLGKVCMTCNDAEMEGGSDGRRVIGDPTEGALLVLGEKIEVEREQVMKKYPFDSVRKRMSIFTENVIYCKGAPDELLTVCTHIQKAGKRVKLSAADKKRILEQNNSYANQALRVLGFAYKEVKKIPKDANDAESDLTFIGLIAMIDPPREQVPHAIQQCYRAGMRVLMITGDHPTTAQAIATKIGLRKGTVITGAALEKMSDDTLREQIETISIVARAMPEQKVRLVKMLQELGEIVAMTGDGVNDAPALKKADLGIAMGITGTEVAKEVADAILVDDNFASIVGAVKEGRGIYEKIIKSAKYLLSSNAGEITSIFIAVVIGLPWPLVALQILLINVLTDTFPALGLGSDTPEPGLMHQPPRDPNAAPLSVPIVVGIITFGLWIGISTVVGFALFSDDQTVARSTAFATLVFMQLAAVQSYRSLRFNWRRLNPFSNMTLLACIGGAASCVLLAMSHPFLQNVFSMTMIGFLQWKFVLGAVIMGIVVIELSKVLGLRVEKLLEHH